ncbi:MAG: hypothetical protein RL557_583 [archaeon]
MNKSRLKKGTFSVVSLGIVFDTKKRKILIGRRMNDPYVKQLTWSFPGGIPGYGEDLERNLERIIKTKTNLAVKNLGCVFARILQENKKILLMYYLCEVIGGKEKARDDFVELKWVKPEELEKHFTTFFDRRLKEYIFNLK